MPSRPLLGARYRLEEDAFAWIAEQRPEFRIGRTGRPNIAMIADAAGCCTPAHLRRIKNGTRPLTAEVMAGLVDVSGAPRPLAEKKLFVHVKPAQGTRGDLMAAA